MWARHLSKADKAFFLFEHLECEAREELRHCPSWEQGDPDTIIMILHELYRCSHSYVALQEAFFSRRQQDGGSLLEFSLALMTILERVSPNGLRHPAWGAQVFSVRVEGAAGDVKITAATAAAVVMTP